MTRSWVWGAGALVALSTGFVVGRNSGPAPVEFPEVDAGRSESEMFSAVSEALSEPRGFVRAVTLTRLFEGITEANLEGARRAVSARSGLGDPVDIQLFVSAWVEVDPEAAVESIRSWPVKSRRRIAFNVAIREWAARGQAIEAANYLQFVEDDELRIDAMGPLIRGWALSGDYDAALGLAQSLYLDRDVDVVAGFVRGGLQRAGAAEMIGLAQRVLEQEEGPFAQRLVESILSLAGREDPQRAAALLSRYSSEGLPDWLLPQLDFVAKLLRTQDPRRSIEWLLTFPASPARDESIEESMGYWAVQDFEAAWSWFERERAVAGEGALSDEDSLMLTGLVRKMARIRPLEASDWVLHIRSEEGRTAMLKRVAFFRAAQDAVAASAWIDGLELAPSVAEAVREAALRGRQSASFEDDRAE